MMLRVLLYGILSVSLAVAQYPPGAVEPFLPVPIGEFVYCLTGPDERPSQRCAFDLDVDGDVDIDLADYAWVQNIGSCVFSPCRPGAGFCCSEGFFTDPPCESISPIPSWLLR